MRACSEQPNPSIERTRPGRPGRTAHVERWTAPNPPRWLDSLYPCGYSTDMLTVLQTEEFVAWLDALKDKRARVRIAARLRQAEAGSLGDWQPVEGEVSEMRVIFGSGYRLYFVRRGRVIVIILNAGNKSTQKRDIRRALKLAAELGDDL